jgi:hypothetical protein
MTDQRELTARPPGGKRQPLTIRFDWSRPTGRQMIVRLRDGGPFDKLLRMVRRRERNGDGFHKATDGSPAWPESM